MREPGRHRAIGFVGVGSIGLPMLSRLALAGAEFHVFDVSEDALSRCREMVALERLAVAGSPAEVAQSAGLVFLSLPNAEIVEEVCLGERGLIAGGACKIVVDLSTTGPKATRRLAEALAASGVELLSAPVSGAVARARGGDLSIMCAGRKDAFDASRDLLDRMASKVWYLGADAAMAQHMKLVNNVILAAGMTVSFEAMVYAVKAGLDADQAVDILNASTARNYATQYKIPEAILTRAFDSGGSSNLIYKDLSLYLDEARAMGVPMWASSGLLEIWAHVVAQGDGAKDNTVMIRHLEAWAGVVVGGKSVVVECDE